jgi:hypothetical protein
VDLDFLRSSTPVLYAAYTTDQTRPANRGNAANEATLNQSLFSIFR